MNKIYGVILNKFLNAKSFVSKNNLGIKINKIIIIKVDSISKYLFFILNVSFIILLIYKHENDDAISDIIPHIQKPIFSILSINDIFNFFNTTYSGYSNIFIKFIPKIDRIKNNITNNNINEIIEFIIIFFFILYGSIKFVLGIKDIMNNGPVNKEKNINIEERIFFIS